MPDRQSMSVLSLGSVLVLGIAYVSLRNPKNPPLAIKPDPVQLERQSVDRIYASEPTKAKARYEEFIDRHEKSSDKKVQDQVAAARLRVGYLAVKTDGYAAARTAFKQAEQEYKGEGSIGSDFGGLKDQAAYQAAVCLMGEKKDREAVAALQSFIKDYQLSPLVHAAHRRLEMLNPEGQIDHDSLLQSAVAAQEKHIRFETSVCGPKVISFLLDKLGKPKRDYKELAKLCGTTNEGTTIEGMRKGLKTVGLTGFGYELNRDDFLSLKAPAILLMGDHYVALLNMNSDHAIVYDPVKGGEVKFPLPKPDQIDFSIPVLTFSPLELK